MLNEAGFHTGFLASGGKEWRACVPKFLKVPHPLLRAMPTFKVPCPPYKQSFDGAILILRFDNYFRPSNCLVSQKIFLVALFCGVTWQGLPNLPRLMRIAIKVISG